MIRRKYARLPLAQLARQMQRTRPALEKRVQFLFQGARVKGRWSKQERVQLQSFLGVATTEQIAVILRRTQKDVTAAIGRLRNRTKTSTPLSNAELVEFKRVYGARTDADMTAIFGRTLEFIVDTAKRLYLAKDKAFLRKRGDAHTEMPRWDLRSVSVLIEMYPLASNYEIAQQVRRSVKSVVSKAHTLKLTKDYERLRQMGRDNVAKRYEK